MAIYTASTVPSVDTLVHYLSWGQFFGAGFTTCGWTAQTGHGELVASGTGGTYAWTNVVAAPTVSLLPPQAYTFKGAFVPSATYLGSATVNVGTEVDVVTSSGLTYVHITNTSNLATVPASDPTNWQPLNFEIWKSNGSMTSSLPLYMKLIYTTHASSLWKIIAQIGTGVDVNGNITGAAQIGNTAPTTFIHSYGASNVSSFTCYFSGDADNVRWIMWSGSASSSPIHTVVIDRAKTSTGADSDAFAYFSYIYGVNGTPNAGCAILLNSAYGGYAFQSTTTGYIGAVGTGNMILTISALGSSPPLPIYPLLGFQANPLLGVVGVQGVDATDGTTITAWMYGASHNYIVAKQSNTQVAMSTNGVAGGVYPAIRYE